MKRIMENKEFELGQQIAELRGLVVEGFKGVHQRQDTTNGRLLKAEGKIEKLERGDSYSDGKEKGISLSWGVIIAIGGIVVAIITIFYNNHPFK